MSSEQELSPVAPRLKLDLGTRGRPIRYTGISDIYKLQHGTAFVALKRWRYGDISVKESTATYRLLDETIAALLKFDHPSLLPYLGVCELEWSLGIVTAWMEQGTISDYLEHNADADRRTLLLQVAQGLEFLHTRTPEIVHGDVHTGNVLITTEGRAVLTDFGLNNVVPDASYNSYPSMGHPPGRFLYTAPELLQVARQVTTRSDVYAFGILAWEVYSGKPAFRELNAMEAVSAFIQGKRPSRAEIERSDFTFDIWRLVNECWAQVPTDRPTMVSVRQRLEGVPEDFGVSIWSRMVGALQMVWEYMASFVPH
ncbi:kinase-like protein [Exidia glandulosa HHB12029]|uniref:Kinase-like protein n=1 Tax=Exidia glandulosa HHB12029 TaxID=1314781 RepID=A0A165L8G0_EXIGL|nr:kinase-like protein [Exidia glandulosa HHB12029]